MLVTRQKKKNNVPRRNAGLARELAQEFGVPVAKWTGNQMLSAVRGIVSAYKAGGGGQVDISSAVAPLAMSMRKASKAPRFTTVTGGVSIVHTEALSVTTTSAAIRVSSSTMTWLAQMASGFEEYRLKAEFGYVPICPATTEGSVMLAWDYDPTDEGEYTEYADFFNTADHCISSAWSPAMIAPKQSGWLKTGEEGEARLWSPGILRILQTSVNKGYFMVRYTVELRKAQPHSVGFSEYTGTYTTNTLTVPSPTLSGGRSGLVSFVGNDITQVVGGKILIIWSTDANIGSATEGGNMLRLGGTAGPTRSTLQFYSNNIGNTGNITTTVVPGGPTSYKVVVYIVPVSPVYN